MLWPGAPRVTRNSPRLLLTLPCPIPSSDTSACLQHQVRDTLAQREAWEGLSQHPIGVRTEHSDSRGLLPLPQSRADCTAQHKSTHSGSGAQHPVLALWQPLPGSCPLCPSPAMENHRGVTLLFGKQGHWGCGPCTQPSFSPAWRTVQQQRVCGYGAGGAGQPLRAAAALATPAPSQ